MVALVWHHELMLGHEILQSWCRIVKLGVLVKKVSVGTQNLDRIGW